MKSLSQYPPPDLHRHRGCRFSRHLPYCHQYLQVENTAAPDSDYPRRYRFVHLDYRRRMLNGILLLLHQPQQLPPVSNVEAGLHQPDALTRVPHQDHSSYHHHHALFLPVFSQLFIMVDLMNDVFNVSSYQPALLGQQWSEHCIHGHSL